jgi:hypothetical protein
MASGQAAQWIVTYRVSADEVAAEAATPLAASATAATIAAAGASSPADAALLRMQRTVKARVMSPGGALAAQGASVVRDFQNLPVSVVALPSAAALATLRADPSVASVEPNRPNSRALVQSLPLVDQPAAVAAGSKGAGCYVAVLDTGADYTHPDLGSCATAGAPEPCRVAYARDFTKVDDGQLDSDGVSIHLVFGGSGGADCEVVWAGVVNKNCLAPHHHPLPKGMGDCYALLPSTPHTSWPQPHSMAPMWRLLWPASPLESRFWPW